MQSHYINQNHGNPKTIHSIAGTIAQILEPRAQAHQGNQVCDADHQKILVAPQSAVSCKQMLRQNNDRQ